MLSSEFNLNIAGIDFDVESSAPLIMGRDEGAYGQFMASARSSNPDAIRVRIDSGVPEPATAGNILFQADETWSMSRNGSSRVISYPARSPVWTAAFKDSVRDVSIVCGQGFTQGSSCLNPMCYPLDQLLLMYALGASDGLILHACGVDLGGRCAVFVGRSGAGKTTISRLFQEAGYDVLSDDRVVLRRHGNGFMAYGTPWAGEGGMAINRGVELAGVFMLAKHSTDEIAGMSSGSALDAMMQSASVPWYDWPFAGPTVSLCGSVLEHVQVGQCRFTPRKSAVEAVLSYAGESMLRSGGAN